MLPDPSEVVSFLKDLSLFNSLDDAQIATIAQLLEIQSLPTDAQILSQGSKAEAFYLIMEGQVTLTRQISRTETQIDVFVRGDFFGEDSLLHNAPEPATASAFTPVIVLSLGSNQFYWLMREIPDLKDRLLRFVRSHQYLEKLYFDWLNEDEVVYQVRRRHFFYLLLSLIIPGLLDLFGICLFAAAFLSMPSTLTRDLVFIFSAILLGLGIGWTTWRWLDWGNDYYVVTNQRVVWIERVIWLYDSRIEAPLNTVLSVNVSTSFIGRLVGFGNVIVTTYTGKVSLQAVGNPYQLAGLITEYQQRSQREFQRSDLMEMQRSVKRIIEDLQITPEKLATAAKSKPDDRPPDQFHEPGWWENYFGNIFKTRIEQGTTITYRKHWLVLIRKTWLPTLITMILLGLVVTFDIMYLLGETSAFSPLTITTFGFLISLVFLFPWWLYQYIDWRNDIYQLTDRSIFDIERKPFGSESRKSAPLENILSLEHQRPGFVGYVLNVGYVSINVGESKFTFDHVSQPARVQQDIFNRMHALRMHKQRDEVARERDRMLKLIELYHEEVGKKPPLEL